MAETGDGPKRKACFFCERTDQKITNEHPWPRWLWKVLPDRGRVRYFQSVHRQDGESIVRNWRDRDYNLQVRTVCDPCNSQWMNRIEIAARPFLEPMILGQRSPLSVEAQTAVATWASMKAMVFESADDEIPIPISHRRAIFERQLPPPGTHIWLGAFVGQVAFQRHFTFDYQEVGRPGVPCYGSTFVVGDLILQVFGQETKHGELRKLGSQLASGLTKIWPVRGPRVWPPPYALDDQALLLASNSFGRAESYRPVTRDQG